MVQMKVRDAIKMILGRLGPKDREFYTEAGRPEMSTYTVFIEPTATGYSAHVPDLPGCVAAAATLEGTRQLIREAIEFHIEGMRINGDAVPEPTPHIEQIEVSA
jgi:predicted RNase H-like HicB family nuclease